LFGQEALPLLVTSLERLRKPHPAPQGVFAESSEIRETLISADVESLEESCALLESLSLDVEDVRLSLARGLTFPDEHDGIPCLSDMLNFLDCGEYPLGGWMILIALHMNEASRIARLVSSEPSSRWLASRRIPIFVGRI
jgi:hypothetical protein